MLIDYSKIEKEIALAKAATHQVKCSRFINEIVGQEIGFQVGSISEGDVIHIANDSRWSLHELIVHILQQTGPAKLHFCTYAIKEYQARLLSNMKADGVLTEIHALVDYRFKKFDPQVEQLLQGCANTFKWMDRLHGKATIISNETWGISIIGSGNLTTNTSRDTFTITCHKSGAEYWINWINKNIQ